MKAGRTSKEDEMRLLIPVVLNKLGEARPQDICRFLKLKAPQRIATNKTIAKYCEKMVDSGLLSRRVDITNKEKVKQGIRKRQWSMVFYRNITDTSSRATT